MGRLKSEQAKSIWHGSLMRFLALLAAVTALYVAIWLLFGASISQNIGNWIADITSPWNYVDAYSYDYMIVNNLLDFSNLQVISSVDADGEQVIAYRDLKIYNHFKGLKYVLVAAVYAIALIAIALISLRRPIHLIDEISEAVSDPDLPKGGAITLPDNLTPMYTELKLLQTRISDSEKAAKEAEERKNELVAYLAHDIRTPMTSVVGYLELICETECIDPDKQHTFATKALNKAERLEGLVEELFEITRFGFQNIPVERESLNVALLFEQIAEEFYPQANASRISIKINAEPELQAFLDPSKIGRALENIMKNGIAHADSGSTMNMNAQMLPGHLYLSISNQGKEIAPEHLDRIFERFYRGDSSRNQSSGGAGLGLAIAKKIVEAHNGEISVTSELGLTTFHIKLSSDDWNLDATPFKRRPKHMAAPKADMDPMEV